MIINCSTTLLILTTELLTLLQAPLAARFIMQEADLSMVSHVVCNPDQLWKNLFLAPCSLLPLIKCET